MKVAELLKSYFQVGIRIHVENNTLKISAPKGVVTAEISKELRTRKQEIITYLLNQHTDFSNEFKIPHADRMKSIPASSSQRGLWLQYQMEGVNNTYNVPRAFSITGSLVIDVLEKSLQTLIERHESLRMTFMVEDGEPCLKIANHLDWKLNIHPLNEDTLDHEITEKVSQPFMLDQFPLFRAHLWTNSSKKSILLFVFHHTVIDGWSLPIFNQELSSLYSSYLNGEESKLPPLELDYADYAAWQNTWLKSSAYEEGLTYWKEALHGAPELLNLPTNYPRPAVQTHHGRRVVREMEQNLAIKLRKLMQREKVTMFMITHTAFALLLGRYSNQEDVVVGVPMANRTRQELEGMLGYFVNTIPVRLDLSENPNLHDLLVRMKEISLDVYTYQDIPFEKLVEALKPDRNAGYSPLFQVIFSVEKAPSSLILDDCQVQNLAVYTNTSKFDLSLHVIEDQSEIRLELIFNTDLFENQTIERMLDHYQRILEWMVSEPTGNIQEIDMLTEEEYQQIIYDWNETTTDYPHQKPVHQLFQECASVNPDKVALSFLKQELTYCELNERANQLAHILIENGISPEVCVGVFIERSIHMLVALLAILKTGGAYVPLNPANSPKWQSTILNDTSAPILLSLHRHEQDLPIFDGQVIYLDDESIFKLGKKGNPSVEMTSDNLAYVMYTSGSTGQPKGNCISHKAIVRLVKNTNYANFSSDEVFLLFAPLAFDASTFEIWGSLLNGAKLVIFPPDLPSLDELADFVISNRVTTSFMTTGFFHQIMEWRPDIVKGLHQYLVGGDVISPKYVRTVLETNPNCHFIHCYGPTENTTFTCCYSVRDLPELEKPIPIGSPISNTQVYVLDSYGKPVPVGVVGELYTGGDGLSREYLNQPIFTKDKFIDNPFQNQTSDRIYKTGDYVRWLADGNIEFIGRMDNQIKIRGFRVELGEIEIALSQESQIKQAVVLLRQDQPGDKRLVAYIIPTSDEEFDRKKLRIGLREKLPAYMIPSAFVLMEAFPLTASGKIDRKNLHAPQFNDLEKQDFVPPSSRTEKLLAKIWTELLGISQVGLKDDFFELGGHSLLAVQMVSRIRQIFGESPPLQVFFGDSTLEGLATSLKTRTFDVFAEGIIPIQTQGFDPPLFVLSAGGPYLRDLVEALGKSCQVYGLHPFENGEQVYRESVQVSARIIARCLLDFYPEGPIQLLGHSGDGCYALETARVLRESGKNVTFLGLLDTYPPPLMAEVRFVDRLDYHLGKIQGKNIIGIIQYGLSVLSRHLPIYDKIVRKLCKREPDIDNQERKNHRHRFLDTYIPELYDGDVTLFLATEFEFVRQHEPIQKWRKVFSGRFDIINVPGKHRSMVEEPAASQLAQLILENLPKSDSDQDSVYQSENTKLRTIN